MVHIVRTQSGGRTNSKRRHGSGKFCVSTKSFVWTATILSYGALCFYAGIVSGMRAGMKRAADACDDVGRRIVVEATGGSIDERAKRKADAAAEEAFVGDSAQVEAMVEKRLREELKKAADAAAASSPTNDSGLRGPAPQMPPPPTRDRFERSVHGFSTGAVRTDKVSFMKAFDFGVPLEPPKADQTDALILYNSPKALPNDKHIAETAVRDDGKGIPFTTPELATENCDAMNVVASQAFGNMRQCTVLVGNYESYHVQRWMRIADDGGNRPLDPKLPLRHVSVGHAKGGVDWFAPPMEKHADKGWNVLRTFLNNVEDVKRELAPIAAKVAVDNVIVVLTCNMGQSELLENFVCSSRARGHSIKNVLVFPTDKEAKDIAEGLGLAVYYDEKNFEGLPSKAAFFYSDPTFVAMMYAKVVCVQLVNMLGYDLLFQDVDIVWYKDPLPLLRDKSGPYRDFDVIAQDDGAHSVRFAPYSANSGFYYARNNRRTRYFFTSFLNSVDRVYGSGSHQQAMITLLNEHAHVFGLRVKILDKEEGLFPSGVHFHNRKPYMRQLMRGEVDPYIFHMSWTQNKGSKLKFFKQIGEWYVKEECVERAASDVKAESDGALVPTPLVDSCCSSEPLISCHYRDKPSKLPCKDSPTIDKNGKTFWQ